VSVAGWNDEWLVCRRYLSEESLALVLEDQYPFATAHGKRP